MLAIERRNAILSQLAQNGKVIVADLSRDFGVTEETIRRDLERLEKDGLATKTYGGAVSKHTAALDPKTAAKVLELTDQIVQRNKLTTLMITHNMADAIAHGNRLIMMHEGKIIVNVSGEEKQKLTVDDLLELFTKASGKEFASDRAMLS